MSYSQEEIERKRLLALQRKKDAQIRNNSPNSIKHKSYVPPHVNTYNSKVPSLINTTVSNESKQTSKSNSPLYGRQKYMAAKQKYKDNVSKNNMKFNKQKERFNPIETQSFFGKKASMTGKCYMINDYRFALETSSYFPPLIETLKTVQSREYDMKTKTWSFHIKDYETIMEKIICFKSDIQITGFPNAILQIFRRNATLDTQLANIDLSAIDPVLVSSLMPFQREGICYGIAKRGRCMIADDMGLGKTIQALGIAHYFRKDWPLLIIVPSSVRYQWAEAIYTFLPSIPAHYIHHFTNTKDFVDNDNIIIVSYDLLVRAVDTFERRLFGFVILDESHVLKSIKTARFKAVQRIVSQARHVVLLSGTPALSRPIELYSQISLIVPNFIRYQEYGIRYCAGEKNSFGWDFSGSSNMQELQLLLKHTCMIRRLKNEVLNQLPSKKREVVMLDPDLIKAGNKEMAEMSKKLERTTLTGVERHNALLQYYSESSFAKQKAVCDYVTKLFENKKKCLIFAHHRSLLDAICEVAELMNIKYIRIDGKTTPERRKYQVDRFQTHDDVLGAILSITAANAGITLTAAQLVVFAELFWNPGILCQAEDRVHRIGQDENVTIQYLVAKDTADDYLWPLIQQKMNVLNGVGLDQDFSLSDINITMQPSDGKQKTLDLFLDHQSPNKSGMDSEAGSNEDIVQTLSGTNSSTTEEYLELLDMNEDDLNFCDWEEME